MSFTVRVMLVDVDDEPGAYGVLHPEMYSRGFSKLISGGNGRTFKLPDAEYNYVKTATASEVLALVGDAVAETGLTAQVLVTPCSAPRVWSNLSRARPLEIWLEAHLLD